MDIVYTFKEVDENDSDELRYSLRSLINLPHSKVVICGDKPEWIKNVAHIAVPQTKAKMENWMLNLRSAICSPDVSDDFILMNDDFFILRPIQQMPILNFGSISDVIERYMTRYPESSQYIESMKGLYDYLKSVGIVKPISYELHAPMILNKSKVLNMLNSLNGQRMFQFRSFYGNYYDLGGEAVEDCKIFKNPVHNPPSYNSNPEKYLGEQMFLSTNTGSFSSGLPGEYIRAKFSQKSIYEV